MAETGTDEAAAAFHADMNPPDKSGTEPARGTQPRRDNGQFSTSAKPVERMFEPREVEGDEFGDTRDGGADRERQARGRQAENGNGRERLPDGEDGQGDVDETIEDLLREDGEGADGEGERDGEPDEGSGQEGEHYEVTVDGEVKTVSLKEALEGYIRTDTFHQRMNKVNEAATALTAEVQKNHQLREHWLKQNQALEEEYKTLIPKEPNWDEEFARDPKAAHLLQKQYDAVKTKIGEMRQARQKAEQERAQEAAENTKKFAESEYAKFIMNNKIPDKATLEKEVGSMRKTALSAGFTEQEVAQVYDSRMLTILRKASKYDRIMAARPKAVGAVNPGQGKTLTPGSGNGGGVRTVRRTDRKGIDAAQRKLAASGSLDDATDFSRTILR